LGRLREGMALFTQGVSCNDPDGRWQHLVTTLRRNQSLIKKRAGKDQAAQRGPVLQAGFLRQQRGETAADAVAMLVALMQLADVLVVFEDMPVAIVMA